MEINKEITVKLTTNDLKEIIIEHMKSKGVNVQSIYFNISKSNHIDDWYSQFPLDYQLFEIICKGVDNVNYNPYEDRC